MLSAELEKGVDFDLRSSWQVRALRETATRPGLTMALESVLSRTYEHALLVMIEAAFPWRFEPMLPCVASNPVIEKNGTITADVIRSDHAVVKNCVLFGSEAHMQNVFRTLADRLKLSDADRVEMFKCVQRWVVADRRLDPNFDPMDPDAKRLLN